MLLPDADRETTLQVAERVRTAIADINVLEGDSAVTASSASPSSRRTPPTRLGSSGTPTERCTGPRRTAGTASRCSRSTPPPRMSRARGRSPRRHPRPRRPSTAGRRSPWLRRRCLPGGLPLDPDEPADVRADRPGHAADVDRDRLDARVRPADHDPGAGHQPVRIELSEQVGCVVLGDLRDAPHPRRHAGLQVRERDELAVRGLATGDDVAVRARGRGARGSRRAGPRPAPRRRRPGAAPPRRPSPSPARGRR